MQRSVKRTTKSQDASRLRVGIVLSNYNSDITGPMYDGALKTLRKWNVKERNIHTLQVAGSFEIPYGCLKLVKKKSVDAVIALGCIIKGETKHDEYIADAVAQGIMHVSLQHDAPIAFGVLTTNNHKQAVVRSRGKNNKGTEAAMAALRSALQ